MTTWRRDFPKCEVCGKPLKGGKNKRLYSYKRFCSLECKRLQVVVRIEEEHGMAFSRVVRDLGLRYGITEAAEILEVEPNYFRKLLVRQGLRDIFPQRGKRVA